MYNHQYRARMVATLVCMVAVLGLLTSCSDSALSRTTSQVHSDIEREQTEWKEAESLLRTALADQHTYVDNFEVSGFAWGTGGEMMQLAGKDYFVDGEVPRGGSKVSVVVTGDPNGHPDDVVYLGVRVAQRDICIYARDVVERASASMTPGLVWAVAMPCVRPDAPTSWRTVNSPLELFDTIPHQANRSQSLGE